LPEPNPISRLTRSPRALAGVAGVLLLAAIVVVVVLLSGGSSSSDRGSVLHTTPARTAVLPKANPHRNDLETIFTEGSAIFADPTGEIAQLHALGVDRVRVSFGWDTIAPDASSRKVPHFNAANPAAYPAASWAPYDEIVRLLALDHMGLDLVLAPPPPLWASGKGAPAPADTHPYWEPSAQRFGEFVKAVGTRYSGHYTPPGQSSPLPRVSFWSIWNEPNLGVMLAPQTLNGPTVEVSPSDYRHLAGAAWTALQDTGHGHDTTLIGELAPVGAYGDGKPGNFSVMAPLRFLRVLYCLGTDFTPLTGHAAAIRACPTTAAASKRFAVENPVLFRASDYAVHPYPQALPPDVAIPVEGSDDAVLGSIGHLFSTLDRAVAAYGSHRHYDVYSTEFGYITSPPATQSGGLSPRKVARWLNWSEYITYSYPRLLSYDQYLLEDPPPTPGKPYKAFASGLETYQNRRKASWYAFRMPVWLPKTAAAKGDALEVWGCVRPAKLTPAARRAPAQIQFRRAGGTGWTTVATASTKTRYGYFDRHVKFPASGTVRIRWAPPSGSAMVSRTTKITVH
jgi:hypothetical protein